MCGPPTTGHGDHSGADGGPLKRRGAHVAGGSQSIRTSGLGNEVDGGSVARVSRAPPIQHRGHQRHEVFFFAKEVFCQRGKKNQIGCSWKKNLGKKEAVCWKKNLGKKEANLKDVMYMVFSMNFGDTTRSISSNLCEVHPTAATSDFPSGSPTSVEPRPGPSPNGRFV